MKPLYFIEVTDTFGGEANYSWVTRHVVKGKSLIGAVNRFPRLFGIQWRHHGFACGDCERYNSKSGDICLFIEEYDEEQHGQYRLTTDDRA